MQIGAIVLKIRAANTRFGSWVGGAAELDMSLKNTLKKQMAFVIPMNDEITSKNRNDTAIDQTIMEKFGVIVALQNDTTQKDKTGITAYDNIEETRAEIFKAILNWEIDLIDRHIESPVQYAGGRLLGINGSYLWYQFDFEYKYRIQAFYDPETNTGLDGVDLDPSTLASFDTLYADYIKFPSYDLPYSGDLPVANPDMSQIIDFTTNPDDGGFDPREFGLGFKIDLNR
jgi:hypothetical protein